ncbi:hypothetical protein [Nannocystis sp. SCPEA4]|uniref:hypothetical protein n=1 Tax=Nannocystis sp. SCPEA4 TaxID=2996787 RepID=UPI002270BC5A|nr:hypothetical protein [Nannocystis sp. SCPEA4]MCY1059801.1 hypothetical protein [Nannocystis sp. SCPEA4]
MKILLVHGRGQAGLDAGQLKRAWLASLARGCHAARVEIADADAVAAFPFYGDRLAELVAQVDAPLGPEIAARGGSDVDEAYLEFRRSVVEEVRVAARIDDAEVEQQLAPGVRERGPQNWEWVQAILRAIDRRFPRIGDNMLDRVTHDVWVYLTAPGVRDEIDAMVGEMLSEEPTVVVGHSLGSVVTYSLLRRARRHTVPLFVTLGSPLGLHAIRRRFTPLKFPGGVTHWFNAYDRRDVVALRGLEAPGFDVRPAVRNHAEVDNHTSNRHGIDGYLDDREVARTIAGAMNGPIA